MIDLRCDICGETDRLSGSRAGDAIIVTCACGNSWERDTRRKCPQCGGTDLAPVHHPIVQKVKGTQMANVGYTISYHCQRCDIRKA